MNTNIVIRAKNLTKNFGENTVINNCNMNVKSGSIYGFLGANGAGKTTILKLLTGLLIPTSGTIEVLGQNIISNRNMILRQIGSLIDLPTFYDHLTAIENLQIHLSYMGVNGIDIQDVLNTVGLEGVGSKPVEKYSLGMRQRLAIAKAIIHKPKILILDEPINGLDPIGVKEIRTLFLHLVSKQGMTVLLSSHILSEIQHMADTIGIIVNGVIVREVGLEQIKSQYGADLENYFLNVISGGSKTC